jgi:hypothetical protein
MAARGNVDPAPANPRQRAAGQARFRRRLLDQGELVAEISESLRHGNHLGFSPSRLGVGVKLAGDATRPHAQRHTCANFLLIKLISFIGNRSRSETPLAWEWSSRLGLTWSDVLRLGGCPQVKRCVPTFVLAG